MLGRKSKIVIPGGSGLTRAGEDFPMWFLGGFALN
jgi:hypothetical protein